MSYLKSTVSHAVMNLSNNLHAQAKARDTDEFREFAAKQKAIRYKRIFFERPYKGVFE